MGEFSDLLSLSLWESRGFAVTVRSLATASAIVVAAWGLAFFVRKAIARARHRAGLRENASVYLIERLSGYVVVFVGVLAAASAIGLDLTSLSIFAGALGVGIGLGLQEVVRNFFAGVVLLLDRSVEVGDFIELAAMGDGEAPLAGEVVSVAARATRIITNDNVDVLVPNALLQENRLINWTRERATRRIRVPFPVAYGSDKDLVRQAALEAARSVAFTLPDDGDRKTQVWLTGFGDSSLNFELVVWPRLEAVKRPGAMMAAYAWAIEDALRRHGLEIPFPQRDVRVRSVFGAEGEAALRAFAPSPESARPVREPTPAAASPNDAEEDLLRQETPPATDA